ncbi:gpi-anchored cell wall organization protein ecm33 protein [Apiospora arundinis]
MQFKQTVSAIAVVGMATGAMAVNCKDDLISISSSGDATQLGNCKTVKGSVTVTPSDSELDFGKLSEVGGDFTCENNGVIVSLKAASLTKIGKEFRLQNATQLSNLAFTSLNSVGSLKFLSLNGLTALNFGTKGIKEADTVIISDTRLSSLEGINVETVKDLDINNNKFLTKFTSSIKSLSNLLNINANGLKLSVEMPNIEWLANATISNVTQYSSPSLATVNGSLRFDSNFFESVSLLNLTEIQTGDLSFVGNSAVKNISFPQLTKVGGGFTIANNTELEKLNSFPKLAMIGGAVRLRGSFDEVSLPAIDDVRGVFQVTSTEDISASCKVFDGLGNKVGGDGGKIDCTSKNQNANNDTSSTGSSDGSSGDGKSGASSMSMSMSTVFSLAAVGGLVTFFL